MVRDSRATLEHTLDRIMTDTVLAACTLTAYAHPTMHTRDMTHAVTAALDNVVHAQYVFTSHVRDAMIPLDMEHPHTQFAQDHDNTTAIDSQIDHIIINDSDNNLTNNELNDNNDDSLNPKTTTTQKTPGSRPPR